MYRNDIINPARGSSYECAVNRGGRKKCPEHRTSIVKIVTVKIHQSPSNV